MFWQCMLCIMIGYIFGMSNMAWYLAKIKRVDLRAQGSGNLGASNATIVFGKGAGVLTFLHDTLKIVLASVLCYILFPELQYAVVLSAVAGILGHMFPIYLRFHGGKGFASFIAMAFVLDWKFGLLMLIGVVLVSFIFDWVVAGTFFHIAITPIHFLFASNWITAAIILVASICILIKHIENIKKMQLGQESRLRSVILKKK